MASITHLERPYARHLGVALLLIVASVGVSLAIAQRGPDSRGAIACASAACAVGTLAVAYYLSRRTALPRWGLMGAAGVMTAGAMATSLAFPSPSMWAREALPLLAMQPTFFIVMSWALPSTAEDARAGAPPAGWTLLATGAVLLALILTSAAIAGRA